MILVRTSKYLSSLLLHKTLVLSFVDVVFSKGGFLDYKKDILNIFLASKVRLSYLDRLAGAFQKKRS